MLPARRVPDRINDDETLLEDAFTVPDTAPADVAAALKGTTEGARARASSLNTLVPRDDLARFGPTTPTQPTRHLRLPGGLIGVHAAAPDSLLNDCHFRPVNTYPVELRRAEGALRATEQAASGSGGR
jgi:hypothetical protein